MASNTQSHSPSQPQAPQTPYQQYPPQQPYPQYPAYPPYTQMPAPMQPPRDLPGSVIWPIIAAMVVIIVVVLAVCLYLVLARISVPCCGGESPEPNISIDNGEPTGTIGQWRIEVASVSSGQNLAEFKIAVIRNISTLLAPTSLDTIKSSGASGSGLWLNFSDATNDDKLNARDCFTLSGTDSVSDYQVVVYWKASGNKLSGDTGRIEQ